MNHHTKQAITTTALIVSVLTVLPLNAHSREPRSDENFSKSQLEAKFDRIGSAVERTERLINHGNVNKAIESAQETLSIAEEEFGPTSFVLINPAYTLIELLGKKRRFEEAEELFKKIYNVVDADIKTYAGYAIAHRIRIASFYMEWNMFDKAEKSLLDARDIVARSKLDFVEDHRFHFDDKYFGNYTKRINAELKRIEELKEINQFKE